MPINYFLESFELYIPKLLYKTWIKKVISQNRSKIGVINIIFSDIPSITKLNKRFLNHNFPTDIITFSYNKNNNISGDIFICPPIIFSNALKYSTTNIEEFSRVIIHGILHLLGYSDKTIKEKHIMRRKENEYLKCLDLKKFLFKYYV